MKLKIISQLKSHCPEDSFSNESRNAQLFTLIYADEIGIKKYGVFILARILHFMCINLIHVYETVSGTFNVAKYLFYLYSHDVVDIISPCGRFCAFYYRSKTLI